MQLEVHDYYHTVSWAVNNCRWRYLSK